MRWGAEAMTRAAAPNPFGGQFAKVYYESPEPLTRSRFAALLYCSVGVSMIPQAASAFGTSPP